MKVYYVAHEWGGNPENAEHAKKVIEQLYQHYPDNCYVSPIHGILCQYDKVRYTQGLAYALALLLQCDAVIVASGCSKSSGVKAEIATAIVNNIPVSHIEDWEGVTV